MQLIKLIPIGLVVACTTIQPTTTSSTSKQPQVQVSYSVAVQKQVDPSKSLLQKLERIEKQYIADEDTDKYISNVARECGNFQLKQLSPPLQKICFVAEGVQSREVVEPTLGVIKAALESTRCKLISSSPEEFKSCEIKVCTKRSSSRAVSDSFNGLCKEVGAPSEPI